MVAATKRETCCFCSNQLRDAHAQLSATRREVDELTQTELPSLVRDSAAHQLTRILRGDYDLKISRQDYFLRNQDQVEPNTAQHHHPVFLHFNVP